MHGWFECIFYLFKEKITFKCHKIKSNHRVLRKNDVDTYGAPVFALDYSSAGLAPKMCTNSNEHSMYIIFLCTGTIIWLLLLQAFSVKSFANVNDPSPKAHLFILKIHLHSRKKLSDFSSKCDFMFWILALSKINQLWFSYTISKFELSQCFSD